MYKFCIVVVTFLPLVLTMSENGNTVNEVQCNSGENFKAVHSNCHKYYKCKDGELSERTCNMLYNFDPIALQCRVSWNVNCKAKLKKPLIDVTTPQVDDSIDSASDMAMSVANKTKKNIIPVSEEETVTKSKFFESNNMSNTKILIDKIESLTTGITSRMDEIEISSSNTEESVSITTKKPETLMETTSAKPTTTTPPTTTRITATPPPTTTRVTTTTAPPKTTRLTTTTAPSTTTVKTTTRATTTTTTRRIQQANFQKRKDPAENSGYTFGVNKLLYFFTLFYTIL